MQVELIDDLTMSTIRNLQKGSLSQMAQTMQMHEVLSKWFTKDKVVKQGGTAIEVRVMNALPDSTRYIHIDDTDDPSIPQLLDKMVIPWRHIEEHYAWYVEEVLMNSGESEIVDLIKTRRDGAKIKTAEVIETSAWATAPAADDTKSPYGVRYWLPPSASFDATGDFYTVSTGAIGGIAPSAANGWTMYGGIYTNVSASDLIRKIRRAMDQTQFKSPIGKEQFYQMQGSNWRLYCGETMKLDIEDVAVAQNESLGRDVAAMDGVTTIRGNPLIRIVPLDSAALTPIFGLNHDTWRVYVLKGRFFSETPQMVMPTNNRGRVVYTNTTYNHACVNRRHNFVLNKTS